MFLFFFLICLTTQVESYSPHGSPVVAFTALLSTHRTVGGNAIVRYDHVVTNWGRAYRPSTGIFTAPYHGLYSFSCTLMSDPSNKVHIDMIENGRRISTLYSASSTYPQSSQTLYLILNEGDRIWMQNANNYGARLYYDGKEYNFFSGTLIRAM